MHHNASPARGLMKLLLVLIVLGILCYGALIIYVCYEEAHVKLPATDPDSLIVLGAQVHADGTPSEQLRLRLESALETYEKRSVLIVTCGAKGADEPMAEADMMKAWLVERGVPPEMILTESNSFNTKQNIENAKALLAGHPVSHVWIITSDYHLPRSLRIATDMGFSAEGIGSPCYPEYWLKNHTREALAWVKYWMQKYLGFPKE